METLHKTCYLFIISALVLAFSGCGSSENPLITEARQEAAKFKAKERVQAKVTGGYSDYEDLAKMGIAYVRDDRVGLCFAYIWGGAYRGGPGLAEVPCEKVRHLLAPSQQKKMAQEEAAK